MVKVQFKTYTPNEIVLFPSNLGERIPKDHPVRLLSRIVDGLDLTELIRTYKSGGTTPFHPRMLLKVVCYAYMNNIYSCRKIEDVMNWNIQYMWLSGNQHPSFSTINRFRSEHMKDSVNSLFIQVVKIMVALGQVSLDVQYIDGTKIESVEQVHVRLEEGYLDEQGETGGEDKECAEADRRGHRPGQRPVQEGRSGDGCHRLRAFAAAHRQGERGEQPARPRLQEEKARQRQKAVNKLQKYQERLKEYEDKLDTMGFRYSYSKTDSGYGSEQNYEFMENNGIEAYVKYNWFHKEQHRPFRNDPFRMENMYYNWEDDYYVCPMGQHMEHVGHKKSVSDNGYISWIDTYRAQRCEGCPLRGQCFKGKGNRTINVNHQLKRYKKKAFERLTSERGLFHRSKRPVEPEAVFGQIKTDKQYKRFRHRGFSKIQMDFGILAMAFNLQKLIKNVGKDQIKAVMEAFSTLFGPLLASLWTLWGKFQKEESSVNKNRQLSNRNLIAA